MTPSRSTPHDPEPVGHDEPGHDEPAVPADATTAPPPLETLAGELREMGLDAFVRPGHRGEVDQLLVVFDPDSPAAGMHAQLLLLPGADEPAILQYYVAFAQTDPAERGDVVCRFLNVASAPLPLGTFGMLEADGTIFYRYNSPVLLDALDGDLVGWTLTMAEYLVGELAPLVGDVAAGLAPADANGLLVEVLQRIESDAASYGD